MKFAWCIMLGLLTSTAQAACPDPLPKAQPGWFAEIYDKSAPFDDKQGLINPPPINSMSVALPVSFSQLDPGGDRFPNVAFVARFRVCEAGPYEFYSILQETGYATAFDCHMTTRVNGSRIADTEKAVALRKTLTSPGRITLEPGWAEVRLSMACGGSSALSFYRKSWPTVYFGARVRGPNDNTQRDFAPGEIVNLGRATIASQGGSQAGPVGSPSTPPPPIVSPAAIPEQASAQRKRPQNLRID